MLMREPTFNELTQRCESEKSVSRPHCSLGRHSCTRLESFCIFKVFPKSDKRHCRKMCSRSNKNGESQKVRLRKLYYVMADESPSNSDLCCTRYNSKKQWRKSEKAARYQGPLLEKVFWIQMYGEPIMVEELDAAGYFEWMRLKHRRSKQRRDYTNKDTANGKRNWTKPRGQRPIELRQMVCIT